MVSILARLVLIACLSSATVFASAKSTFIVHESRDVVPSGFVHLGDAPAEQMIDMRINLAMGDQAGLQAALEKASTPGSPTFRQWLTKEEVESFAAPSASTLTAVNAWLNSFSVTPTPATPAGDWLKFSVPVSTANEMLNAQFSVFNHTDTGATSIRTLEYSVPAELQRLIRAVHPTTSFSGPLRGRSPVVAVSSPKFNTRADDAVNCNATITPACLQTLYNIPATSVPAGTKSTLAVSAFDDQNANLADLAAFLQEFRPDIPSNTTFSTTLIDDATNDQTRSNAGVEANLDIQYTVGIATGIPTAFVDVGESTKDGQDEGFLDIINALIAESNPPLVISTSYGFDTEASLSESLTVAMCNSYMQLTSRGVSITFASGDGGVASTPGVQCNGKPFPPTFPTCPFATLVGATQNVPETSAGLSAGGFSNYFAQPSWQADAVDAYITKLGSTYEGLYNKSGRAYPDVSAQGERVQIVVDGRVGSVGGTSCASPIFSSVVALINDELLANGQSPLGFLNPWIYANPQAFNDITTGSNPGCGTSGFPAMAGWDPVTGMGSPNYVAMRAAAGLS